MQIPVGQKLVTPAGSLWLCCLLVSSVGKLQGSSAEQVTGNRGCYCCVGDTGSLCSSSVFLATSIHLTCAGLWVEWNWSGSFLWNPERLGRLVAHMLLLFQWELFLAGLVRLALSSAGQRGGMMQAKWSGSSIPFWVVLLRFFVLLCCWSLLSGFLSSPTAVFVPG